MMKGVRGAVVLIAVLFCGVGMALNTDSTRYQLTTHVLDTDTGNPLSGIAVVLYRMDSLQQWVAADSALTDLNGRVDGFLAGGTAHEGVYKLLYRTEPYFAGRGEEPLCPFIEVVFRIRGDRHYHIPLSVAVDGYSIFR